MLLSFTGQESKSSEKTLQSHRHPSSSFVDSIMVAMMKTQEPETETSDDSGVLIFHTCIFLATATNTE